MADSPSEPAAYGAGVNLLITLVREQPPAGEVRVVGDSVSADEAAAPASFSGWLGLMRALEALVEERRAGAGR
jgi:hypothetical protein